MKRLALVLCLMAFSWRSAADEEAVKLRLAPLLGQGRASVAVYDQYPSGRPRRVIGAVELEGDPDAEYQGFLLLARLPDRDTGKATLLNRVDLQDAPVLIEFLALIDAKDIVVSQRMRHVGGSIYRIVGDKLVRIAEQIAEERSRVDINGDGTPELVWTGYEGPIDDCAPNDVYGGGIVRWNGTEYVPDGRHYAALGWFSSEGAGEERQQIYTTARHRYFLHVYPQTGVRDVKVTVEGKVVAPGPIRLKPGCHSWGARIRGRNGASAWIFFEERAGGK